MAFRSYIPSLLCLFLSWSTPCSSSSSTSVCQPPSGDGPISSHLPPPESTCEPDTKIALTDHRFYSGTQQCRTACSTFSHPSFKYRIIPSNCTSCPDESENYSFTSGCQYSGNFQICFPRSSCIESCGPELPGCVYTGACSHQICMRSSANDNPAKVGRVTYSGPGTYFTTIDDNGVKVTTSSHRERIAPMHFEIPDQPCGLLTAFRVGNRGNQGDTLIFNDESRGGQCRSISMDYRDDVTEVVRLFTKKRICEGPAGKDYLKGQYNICIPHEKCVESHGPQRQGCIYDGTCQSQLCFSGLDNKKAATISFGRQGDESDIRVSVDNNLVAEMEVNLNDPPAFSDKQNASDPAGAIEGNEDGAESSVAGNGDGTESSGAGKWAWLGPVLGLFGATLASLAGIFAAYIVRNGSNSGQNAVESAHNTNDVAEEASYAAGVDTVAA